MSRADELEAIARGIDAVDMFARFNDWTGDHVTGLPIEICRYTEGDDIEVVARYPGRNEKDGGEHLARHIKDARALAALAAIEALGLVVVPREPTEAMIETAFLGVMNARDRDLALPISGAWAERNLLRRRLAAGIRAMIAAALPAAPQGRG